MPEQPLASGRDADVFAAGAGRVRRRYRDGSDPSAEAALMAYVGGHGYPVPTVFAVDHADLVMERLDGPTMAGALVAGELEVAAAARMLAALHDRLHVLPARSGCAGDDRMLHLDLHPENVMVTSRGLVVIDWRTAREGPPDLDVALSSLIMAQVAADPADPRAAIAGTFLGEFVAHVEGDPVRQLDQAVARRRADPNTTGTEHAQLDDAAALVRAAR